MSNLDGAAISQIKNMVVAALSLGTVEKSLCPAVVLPGDFNVKSLEHLQEGRYRFRGAMDTTSITDFVKYSLQHGVEGGVSCFIDADVMSAKTIFNIGTIGERQVFKVSNDIRCNFQQTAITQGMFFISDITEQHTRILLIVHKHPAAAAHIEDGFHADTCLNKISLSTAASASSLFAIR